MTSAPFQEGDQATILYSKPLGLMTVKGCHWSEDSKEWFCYASNELCAWAGPARHLVRAET